MMKWEHGCGGNWMTTGAKDFGPGVSHRSTHLLGYRAELMKIFAHLLRSGLHIGGQLISLVHDRSGKVNSSLRYCLDVFSCGLARLHNRKRGDFSYSLDSL